MLRHFACLSAALAIIASGCAEDPEAGLSAGGAVVRIEVAPLDLPGLSNAVYTFTVTNEAGETVWTRTVDSASFGSGAGGDVSYVGPCDATDGPDADAVATNAVSLTIDSLEPLSDGEWVDPSPLVRQVRCDADADNAVTFDVTVMRRARQGFFDVSVELDTIFCSAKVDCEYGSGQPIELLHNPATGQRDQTLVWAVACAAPAGSDTHLYTTAPSITCDNGPGPGDDVVFTLETTGAPGRKGPVAPLVFEHSVTRGVEGLPGYDKLYQSLAVGLDEPTLGTAGHQGCHFDARVTATKGPLVDGQVPPERVYPEIVATVPLNGADGTLLCTQHPLDRGNGVATTYTAGGRSYANELFVAFGAGVVTSQPSGANVAPTITIISPADGATAAAPATVSLEALVVDEEDLTAAVTWTSDLDGALGTGTPLSVSTLSPGTHQISAAVSDSAGLSASATVTITVTAALGDAASNPATSCLELFNLGRATGTYFIQTDLGPRELYCDMTPGDGGWTLVAEAGTQADVYGAFLRADMNVANLTTFVNEGGVMASVGVIDLAVNHATEIRFSNSDAAAFKWVRWPLHPSRTLSTWWNHAAGQAAIDAAPDDDVTVTAWTGATATCKHNRYGVMPWPSHGGAYPFTSYNAAGNTAVNDLCMSIGVMVPGSTGDGFTQNGNGFDAPPSQTEWPNTTYTAPPLVSIWLR